MSDTRNATENLRCMKTSQLGTSAQAKKSILCRKLIAFTGKRGVSPMVATMLMIFFAVALGTVIMTWGTSYAAQQGDLEEKTEEAIIKCEKFVLLHHSQADTCASSIKKRVSFKIKNDGQIAVNGLKVVLIGQNNFETTVFDLDDMNLQPGEERVFNQNYDYARLGHLLQVEVHPRIFFRESSTQYHKCAQKLVIEDVEKC